MAFTVPGPCTCTWNGANLGIYSGGVVFRPTTGWVPVLDDEHGDEPATFIFGGKGCVVEFNGLQVSSLVSANAYANGTLLAIGAGATGAIGKLASAIAQPLTITERDGSTSWQALLAVPSDPTELFLSSTKELIVPLRFFIVPDANNKLFATVPGYIN